jgi:hypothetical protein
MNTMNKNPVDKFFNSRKKFNNAIKNGTKKLVLEVEEKQHNGNSKYKTEKVYQASFDEIEKFVKESKIKQSDKKAIDSIIFHTGNNDGISCAFVFWKFITNSGKNENPGILMKGIQPDFSTKNEVSKNLLRVEKHIIGRNVLVVDLAFNETSLNYIAEKANSMIVIDNHPQTNTDAKKSIFSTMNHAASASLFKFFFPKNNIPLWLQYVDTDDAKLFLPFLPHINMFSTFMQVRITKCNMLTKRNAFDNISSGAYEQMNYMLADDNLSWMIFAGSYMNEIKENFNQILASNAYPCRFYGYDVVILNLEFQGLDKNVARQMITNRKNQIKRNGGHGKVDFAVIWSYHINQRRVRIQLIDDHVQRKLSMPDIAKKIANKSKYKTGQGGGFGHIANFFLNDAPNFLNEAQTMMLK